MKRAVNFNALIMAAVLLLGMASCVSVGRKIDQDAAAKIEKGKTTREEVIRLIGSPDRVTITGQGDTMFMYSYARATAKPATFIPIFGPLVGGANVQHQMYMVTFGPDGVVKNFINSYGGTEASQGLTTGSKASMPDVEADKRAK
ncbi:MAG: outer membrane protein assembly factor BamE domain-containing protein [Desulfobaccales bacterium]